MRSSDWDINRGSDIIRCMKMRIAELRKERGLTQDEVAHALDQVSSMTWTQASVSRIERGEQSTTLRRLAEIAAFYSVDISELFEYQGSNPLVDMALKLDPERAKLALELLRTLEQHTLTR